MDPVVEERSAKDKYAHQRHQLRHELLALGDYETIKQAGRLW
jgi:hypothetical protein